MSDDHQDVINDGHSPTVVMKHPVCVECKTRDSTFWHRSGDNGVVLCNTCHDGRKDNVHTRTLRSQSAQSSAEGANSVSSNRNAAVETADSAGSSITRSSCTTQANSGNRKSHRAKTAGKSRALQNAAKLSSIKGRSRKTVLKKNPLKAPTAISTVVTSDFIFYEGHYWQVGDVVSAIDEDDGLTYYAQLRGFLQDQYCNKSAVITWLVPTNGDAADCDPLPTDFNAKFYVAGPEEDLPRDMCHFTFICHAPSDYFFHRSSYCSRTANSPAFGCIWTRLGPEIQSTEAPSDSERNPFASGNAERESRQLRTSGDRKTELGKKTGLNRDKGQSNKATSNRVKDKNVK